MMTRLKMKHYFYAVLLERMGEAAVSTKPLSVIMIDIDFFKKVNDKYGHHVGDLVIKDFTARAAQMLRLPDILARFGGEEFEVWRLKTRAGITSHPFWRI